MHSLIGQGTDPWKCGYYAGYAASVYQREQGLVTNALDRPVLLALRLGLAQHGGVALRPGNHE